MGILLSGSYGSFYATGSVVLSPFKITITKNEARVFDPQLAFGRKIDTDLYPLFFLDARSFMACVLKEWADAGRKKQLERKNYDY